jgi:hypothetical protein
MKTAQKGFLPLRLKRKEMKDLNKKAFGGLFFLLVVIGSATISSGVDAWLLAGMDVSHRVRGIGACDHPVPYEE